jgi:hypothetical protein
MLLTNSNGECRDGSSNKTPHIVVAFSVPPLVAQLLQQLRASHGEEEEGGRSREPVNSTAKGAEIQGPEVQGHPPNLVG